MVIRSFLIESMNCKITHLDGIPVVKLDIDPPHHLTLQEMGDWMVELRESNSDLYAELVPSYILLCKATRNENQ